MFLECIVVYRRCKWIHTWALVRCSHGKEENSRGTADPRGPTDHQGCTRTKVLRLTCSMGDCNRCVTESKPDGVCLSLPPSSIALCNDFLDFGVMPDCCILTLNLEADPCIWNQSPPTSTKFPRNFCSIRGWLGLLFSYPVKSHTSRSPHDCGDRGRVSCASLGAVGGHRLLGVWNWKGQVVSCISSTRRKIPTRALDPSSLLGP
jgi:hypothetical protein